MKMREKSTRQPEKKKTKKTHQDGPAADPACRQLSWARGENQSADRPEEREQSLPAEWRRRARSQALEKDGSRVLRTNCGWRISLVMEWIFF